ncbi:protein kinase domain-containing protein [Euzebya tangerina]|uniref:protein kinase domain-containing protein n=1 Tax=Euzebya tangerina TaxID=591198 RepID=UPI000E31A5E8|nr:protein kinase [Euzebya tangerina]
MGPPATSDLLANRYVLEEHIAVGGMAAVWRAHDEVLARTVAIKILHDDLSRDATIRERFRREAVAAAKLVHPGIVSLFDTGLDGDRVYLVIEFIDGQTLADRLKEGPLEPDEAARITLRIASALAHAHDRGIVHRDIKPANVLLTADGGVKVTDFGIAKAARDASLTMSGQIMGTAAYVAPEQLTATGEAGSPSIDGRADLYALGLCLYEMVTGRKAFPGTDPVAVARARLTASAPQARRVRADIPKGLEALITELTAFDPENRPQSAHVVVQALRPFQPDPAIPLVTEVDPPAESESIRSELRWLFPVAGLLVLAGGLVGIGTLSGPVEPTQISLLDAQEVTPPPLAGPTDEPEVPEATPEPTPVEFGPITAFDPPGGDGTEQDDELVNIADGDRETVWTTEQYDTAAFGNLKNGVGFHIDLRSPTAISSVALTVPRGGFDVELRVADRPDADPANWATIQAINDIPAGTTTYGLPDMPEARYLLVWITGDLQPFRSQFRAEVAEVVVTTLAS